MFFIYALTLIASMGEPVYVIDSEIDLVARTVYGEARGQSFRGKKAVAHVVINRAKRKKHLWDHSLSAVVLRKKQFSCWNPGDPNHDKMLKVTVSNKEFRLSKAAVLVALSEPDFTKGSTHYFAT